MAKVISEMSEQTSEATKMVSIKHTRVMKNANGNDVTVLDYEENKDVDTAISDAEAELAVAEAKVTELKADIAEYKKIKG